MAKKRETKGKEIPGASSWTIEPLPPPPNEAEIQEREQRENDYVVSIAGLKSRSFQTLSDLPDAVITGATPRKYILAMVRQGRKKRLLFWTSSTMAIHDSVAADLMKHLHSSFRVDVEGGGKIGISVSMKIIALWDESLDFGKEDRRRTVRILKKLFPDFEIKERE